MMETLQLFFAELILLLLFYQIKCGTAGPAVSINDEDTIHGIALKTRGGRTISGFLGIPYAQPPVGNLRFANPVPLAKGSLKDYQATKEANECIQPDYWDFSIIRGSEDCLYLYVYTPYVDFKKIDKLYPVLIFSYGGDFRRGNASFYSAGPGYLLDKDVLLVGVNSRLDMLGYLSTNDEECPGNFALKDQYLAMKWVHDNIKAFGGDPARVTLFGQSTGAITVQMHSYVDKTKNLFSQMILDSNVGNGIGLFQYNPKYADQAKVLAEALKCPTSSSKEMIKCFRGLDAAEFVKQAGLFGMILKYYDGSWGPCNEPNITGAYFPMKVNEAALTNMRRDMPTLYGVAAQAALYVTKYGYTMDDFYKIFHNNEICYAMFVAWSPWIPKDSVRKMCHLVMVYYSDNPNFMEESRAELLKQATDMYTDAFYYWYQIRTIQRQASPTAYQYVLDYRGVLGTTSKDIDNNENLGACDMDILIYLFPIPPENFRLNGLQRSAADMKMVDIVVDYFSSFMTDGKPKTRYYPADMWQPFKNSSSMLIMGQNGCYPAFKMGKSANTLQLWDAFYAGDVETVRKLVYSEVFNPKKLIDKMTGV